MRDGNRHVRVFVSRAALQGHGSAIAVGEASARFDAFRSVYEGVAKEKYQTGAFKASMTIDVTDLNEYLDERRAAAPLVSPINSGAIAGVNNWPENQRTIALTPASSYSSLSPAATDSQSSQP
jgi:hypothetical protein